MKRLKRYIAKYGFVGFKLYVMKKAKLPFVIKICIPQLKDNIKLRSNSSDIEVFEQIFINEEYKFATDNEPQIIIDAGANIGLASIYYSIIYPKSKIIAIEPETSNYELLKENTKKYSNIHCINKALWNKNVYLKISNPNDEKFSFIVEESINDDGISAITIDELMKQYNISFIDILKIDIEGAEKEVFSNQPTWLSDVGIVIIELHDTKKVGCSRSFYTSIEPFVINEFRKGENIIITTKNSKNTQL